MTGYRLIKLYWLRYVSFIICFDLSVECSVLGIARRSIFIGTKMTRVVLKGRGLTYRVRLFVIIDKGREENILLFSSFTYHYLDSFSYFQRRFLSLHLLLSFFFFERSRNFYASVDNNFFLIHRANQRGAILLKNPYILGDTPILILLSIRDTNKSYTVSRRVSSTRRRKRRRRMLLSMMKRIRGTIGADK